ncbi:glycosyltransferase family 4 protein [Nesterenkonia ebinurensis]|uniref:glycosyltransferase family 4 protein n=1 Tax=Nesterenkonia ebinurensis TaxID=2608252 RepID=UPI00123D5E56|nr:glycosyltransferase family 1 protein [Nesterenkonia ebinurensis]
MRGTPYSEPPAADAPLRVLVVTESFLPQINGVTNSVCRVLEHLQQRGHTAAAIAPTGPEQYAGAEIHRVGGLDLPGYDGFTVGMATRRRLRGLMDQFRPDVVHVASPFVLGYAAVRAANSMQIPVLSIYQTDVVGFARRYRMRATEALIRHRLRRIHIQSDLTLAPSTASIEQLEELGIPRLRFWPRGIDTARFAPQKRSDSLRTRLLAQSGAADTAGEVLVGYVGRLAKEKDLDHLQTISGTPGIRLVLVGDGPRRDHLEALLPEALFLGELHGEQLAEIVASLDVFVHTGAGETFCQAVQEALASGVPAVGPSAGGLKDRIEHGTNGLHYTPGSLEELCAVVRRLAHDTALRRTMGTAAREALTTRSWEAMNDLLIEHYRDAITGAQGGPTVHADSLQYRRKGLHGLAV